jgi:IS1 family transposase
MYLKNWELPKRNESLQVVELDEVHTYVGQKKLQMDIAVDRYGKRVIAFGNGDRSTQTGLKLCVRIKDLKTNTLTFDRWKSYEEFVPSEKHAQIKA